MVNTTTNPRLHAVVVPDAARTSEAAFAKLSAAISAASPEDASPPHPAPDAASSANNNV